VRFCLSGGEGQQKVTLPRKHFSFVALLKSADLLNLVPAGTETLATQDCQLTCSNKARTAAK
jgi:hypothetical protein